MASRVQATLALAFCCDPVNRYWWPEASDDLHRWPRFTHAFGERGYGCDSVIATSGFEGVAMWLPPGVESDPAQVEALGMPDNPDRDALVTEIRAEIARFHPVEPHWYLWVTGVDPAHRGRGIGAALLSHMLARVDGDEAIAYLEATSERNARLYERHGFEVCGRICVGDIPPLIPMVRPAQRA